MFGAIMSGLSGLYSNLFKLRASTSNVANVDTSGYKAVLAEASVSQTGGASFERSVSQRQGAFCPTNGPLDLMIEGNGFFKVMDEDANVAYTRAGRFHVDSEGYLATSDGFRLSPPVEVGGDIDGVRVYGDGTVWGKNGQTGQVELLGRLQLSQFPNPSALTQIGGGKYTLSAESGSPTWGAPGTGGLGDIASGGLEMSNVDIASEMVDQMLSQRGVEANVKSIQASNEMLGTVLDIVE